MKNMLFDWLLHAHLGHLRPLFRRVWRVAARKPRECKLMFERYARDRGTLWCRGAFTSAWSVRRSFIFIAAGTAEEPDCRELWETLRRELVFAVAAPPALLTETAAPFPYNELVCIAFIGEWNGNIFLRISRKERKREKEREKKFSSSFFPFYFSSDVPTIPTYFRFFEHHTIKTFEALVKDV